MRGRPRKPQRIVNFSTIKRPVLVLPELRMIKLQKIRIGKKKKGLTYGITCYKGMLHTRYKFVKRSIFVEIYNVIRVNTAQHTHTHTHTHIYIYIYKVAIPIVPL